MKKLLLAALLIPAFSFADESEVIGPFSGLNNTENSAIIPANMAQDLLNVDITEQSKSIKKRRGYGAAFTLSNATSPVHGVYTFYDSNGASVDLYFNDRRMNVSVSGGSPSVFFSTGTNGATYQCVDSAGFAYCANTSRDAIIKVNSSTYTLLTGFTSTGTMVTVTPERLVQAGFAGNPSGVNFSKSNDFSVWTPGGNPTDPITFTITSPGSGVKHITYAHGRVYWFKDASFGYILEGATHADWRVVTVNAFLGNLYNTSIFRDEVLYFQGNDGHFYAYDGSNLVKLSKDIQATIDQTQGRTSNSWTQSTQSDWQASSITPQGYLDIARVAGSVMLSTDVALSPFVDSSSANFSAGTLTNVSATIIDGAITLSTETNGNRVFGATAAVNNQAQGLCPQPAAQSFYAASGFLISSATVLMIRGNSSVVGDLTMSIKRDSGGSPGSVMVSTSVNVSTFAITSSSVPIFGASTTITVNFSPTHLQSGSTYWLSAEVGCSSQTIIWFYDNSYSTMTKVAGSGTDGEPYIFGVYGKRFNSSGNIVSRTFDNGVTTNTWIWNWNNFYASGTIPSGTSLTWETQTSSFSGGPFESLVSVSTGSAPTSTVQRYIRYKGSFSTTDTSTSPVVTDVVVNVSSRIRPSGVLYSQVNNAANLSTWDSFVTDQQNNGGTISWFVRSSTGVFYASATVPAWTAITPGSIPTISTNPYFQAASSFSVSSISQNPIMNSFTFNWFEGAASDKTYAIYHDNSNWWSVASGTGATTNNKILRFNLLNPSWTIYNIGTGGMLVRSQSLYFGSVSAGKIYKYGEVDTDDGSDITAYWQSKDFSGSSPFLDKDYKRLSSFFSKVSNSTATVTYTIDGSSATSYNVDLGSSTSNFIQRNVNLPLGKTGKTISYKIGNTANPFEIFGAVIDYVSKSWVPK